MNDQIQTTMGKNDIASNVSREQVFAVIDDYFREEQAEISIDVSREELLKELQPEVSRIKGVEEQTENAVRVATRAEKLAQKALEEAKKSSVVAIEIKRADVPTVRIENPHRQFALLLNTVAAGCHAYLAGPAGSGKTTAAEQTAKALGLPFHFTGAVATEFQLTGFVDARGQYHTTPFRRWCEQGGVFLWDEIDASDARAILRFNAALANGVCEFPDGEIVTLHKSCVTIAAANTYGQGADRVYIGRNQLDGASLDRFVLIGWEYDENLEVKIAGNPEWTAFVQTVRRAVESLKIRAVVSPRASIFGARLLAQGIDRATVENMTIFKGMDLATVQKIRAQARI